MTDDEHPAAVAETHVSTVFFTADRAYKLLKPIATSFLDHRDTDVRMAAATRELELNRRLAPDVYLGTADVLEDDDVVDRMVVMRRLPDERRLPALVGDPGFEDCVRSVARAVAAFHAGLDPVTDGSGMSTRDAMARNWADNVEVIEQHADGAIERAVHDRVEQLAFQYLDHRDALFTRRIDKGMARDGHGDLTAEDIFCLDDGPRILDCLAFRDDYRIADVLADTAFLAMDLHRLAGRDTAIAFMNWYQEFSNEHHPSSLAHHYVAYRASVRAKVACVRYSQTHDETQAELARIHLELALSHLERARIRLVLIGGAPGVGKSTVARGVSDRLGWVTLQSDELRKDLAGMGHLEHDTTGPDAGIYTPEMTDRTYSTLLEETAALLDQGESVILDASWTAAEYRERAAAIADAHDADLIEVECQLDRALAKERVVRRLAAAWDSSDATPEVVDLLADRRDPWPTAIQLPTAGTIDDVIDRAVTAVCADQLESRDALRW